MHNVFTQIAIDKVDDLTIERTSNGLAVKDGGITNDKIASATITEDKRAGMIMQTITGDGFTVDHQNRRVVILEGVGNFTSDSTTAIADGSVDGQELLIVCRTSVYMAITIKNNANTLLWGNGDWYRLFFSDQWVYIVLKWDATNSRWVQLWTNDGLSEASGLNAHAEGLDNTASGDESHAEGHQTTASANYSHTEGKNTEASAQNSHAGGYFSKADIWSAFARASGRFSITGDAQYKQVIAYGTTNDGTQIEIYPGNSSFNRIIIPTDHCYSFLIQVSAKRTETSMECAGYILKGVIKNDSGTTSIVGSVTKEVIAEDDANWDVTAEADNTNEALSIKVTGASGKTIHWVAVCHLVEVG